MSGEQVFVKQYFIYTYLRICAENGEKDAVWKRIKIGKEMNLRPDVNLKNNVHNR